MGQDATFEDEFDLDEAEGWSMNEGVWIKTTNLNENVIQVLAMLEGILSPINLGYGIFQDVAHAIKEGAQS